MKIRILLLLNFRFDRKLIVMTKTNQFLSQSIKISNNDAVILMQNNRFDSGIVQM